MSNSSFEWCQSAAHLLFLSKFSTSTVPGRFRNSEAWTKALGEAPEEAIKRFLEDRVIEPPALAELLDYKCSVSDLKAMLKDRRLPVSGRKKGLIDRLVQADPEGMKAVTSTVDLLQCSENGRSIAENFLLHEEEKQIRAEELVLEKLKEHKFHEAALLVASFEADQVFPRGLNIEWKNYDPASDLAMLESMFSRKPKILASINDEQLEKLRIAAAMIHLWGTDRLWGTQRLRLKGWLPDFDTSLRVDNLSAARMIIFDATHQVKVALYKRAGVQKVEISAIDDESHCQSCRRLTRQTYAIQEVPDLPYELCTSDMGCRCLATPASGTFL